MKKIRTDNTGIGAVLETVIEKSSEFPVSCLINEAKGEMTPLQWHDYIEILYVAKGKATQRIGQDWFSVEEGDVVIIQAGDLHTTLNESGDCKIIVLLFYPYLLNLKGSEYVNSQYFYRFINGIACKSKIFNVKDYNPIAYTIKEILDEFNLKKLGFEFIIRGLLLKLIGLLIRGNVVNYSEGVSDNTHNMENVLRYVEENFANDLDQEIVAKHFGYNTAYFSRWFKKHTGRNFKEYIDYVRVQEAIHLLPFSKFTIDEIASMTGFLSESAFYRTFKRVTGMSPSKFK